MKVAGGCQRHVQPGYRAHRESYSIRMTRIVVRKIDVCDEDFTRVVPKGSPLPQVPLYSTTASFSKEVCLRLSAAVSVPMVRFFPLSVLSAVSDGSLRKIRFGFLLTAVVVCVTTTSAEACDDHQSRACAAGGSGADLSFSASVWHRVLQLKCLRCHREGGDAADTRLIFIDPARSLGAKSADLLQQNFRVLSEVARVESAGRSLLLSKPLGELDHGGGAVLSAGSSAHRLLVEYVERLQGGQLAAGDLSAAQEAAQQSESFFAGISLASDRQLLRRATLSLAGRLPSQDEQQRVTSGGREALSAILMEVQREEAYFERLREAFNDIFLTLGVDGNPDQTVLSYEHFEKTRGWYQSHDLSHISDEKERRQAGYKLANDYRRALLEEPMRLVEYIVRNDRPFSEILTADYIMVSPYSARGYGVFEQLREQFRNPDDPLEFLPVKLAALRGRNRSEDQESATGFYPHAGLLSTFQYLSRYPTTETNRNRLRARMYYLHFLGTDILELASRGSDAAAATAGFAVPTMQAAECVVCHRTLDPVAGLFQDYWRFDTNFAIYGRRKEGWFEDMFAAGFEGTPLPNDDRWRSLQWLGEQTVKDPRFARTMAGHAWQMLTGRRPLLPPQDIDDPLFAEKRRAYDAQQCELEAIALRFVDSGYNFRELIRGWVVSDFYRAQDLESNELSDARLAELSEVGVVRLLSPEQLERRIAAVFGKEWGRLSEQTAILYGGIDSKEVTDRATDPSGAMGSIQRTMSNDVACRNTALDFSRPPEQRLLFPGIEPDVVPGASPEADKRIREAIVHLHDRILGRSDAVDSAEVERSFELFAAIVADATSRGRIEPQEIWHCRQGVEKPVPDPHYTVRAWRALVTYLLRQPEFLYE